jgi:sigma-E factor negative regulatory protein RseA
LVYIKKSGIRTLGISFNLRQMNMKDQLSALMDGEFDIESAEHLITSAKSGGELKSCWAHYHLIGDSMRGETHMSHGFSSRVMSALETEPTVLAPNIPSETPSLQTNNHAASRASSIASYKSTKFWSVAASAAAVMFVGVMVMQQQVNAPEQLAPVEIAQSVPTEYLQAHQAAAPNGAAYYIQTASYTEPQ